MKVSTLAGQLRYLPDGPTFLSRQEKYPERNPAEGLPYICLPATVGKT